MYRRAVAGPKHGRTRADGRNKFMNIERLCHPYLDDDLDETKAAFFSCDLCVERACFFRALIVHRDYASRRRWYFIGHVISFTGQPRALVRGMSR